MTNTYHIGDLMTKLQNKRPELITVGKLRECTLEICRCEKYVCTMIELKEYEILEEA